MSSGPRLPTCTVNTRYWVPVVATGTPTETSSTYLGLRYFKGRTGVDCCPRGRKIRGEGSLRQNRSRNLCPSRGEVLTGISDVSTSSKE